MNNVNEPHLENIARTPRFPCHIWVYQYSRGDVFVKKGEILGYTARMTFQ